MTYKSCYHTNHWYIPALFKAKTLLKCSLTLTLAAHIVLRVVTIDLIVCFRIIAFGINTIFNTAKFIVTEVKFVVKSPAEPWVFNFSRIAWRYCWNSCCCFNSALHHIEFAVHLKNFCFIGRNTYTFCINFPAVFTLILNIVNCKQALDIVIPWSVWIEQIVVNRYKCCLPVITVNHIRMEVNVWEHFENCSWEECKSLGIVIVTVKCTTLEIVFIVNEIICTVVPSCPEKSAILMTPCNRYGKVCNEI